MPRERRVTRSHHRWARVTRCDPEVTNPLAEPEMRQTFYRSLCTGAHKSSSKMRSTDPCTSSVYQYIQPPPAPASWRPRPEWRVSAQCERPVERMGTRLDENHIIRTRNENGAVWRDQQTYQSDQVRHELVDRPPEPAASVADCQSPRTDIPRSARGVGTCAT